jgi:predicted anti-sigma-YlaC factor YlaD
MKCPMYEKWLSDALDGALPERKTRQLESHLAACPSCRSQRDRLLRLQQESIRLAGVPASPDYWANFSARLERRLQSQTREVQRRRFRWRTWQWAGAAAAAIILSVLGSRLVTNRQPTMHHEIFNYEECLNRLGQQIGDDSDLAANFNLVLWDSIGESLGESVLEERPRFSEDPFSWEGMSDEEWEAIGREVQEKTKT